MTAEKQSLTQRDVLVESNFPEIIFGNVDGVFFPSSETRVFVRFQASQWEL